MSSAPPTPRNFWRPGRLLLAAALLLAAVVVVAVVFRQALATRAATAYLESQGVVVRSLEVSELNPDAIEITDLSLGKDGELKASRIHLTPAITGFEVSLSSASIEGLRLHLDVTGKAPLLGSLQEAFDRVKATGESASKGPSTATAPSVPDISLQDAQVIFVTPSGPMTASLQGGLRPDRDGALSASAALKLDSTLGRLQADLTATRGADGATSLSAKLVDGQLAWEGFAVGSFGGSLSASQAPGQAPKASADLDLGDLAYTPADGAPLRLARGKLTAKGDAAGDGTVALHLEGDKELLDLKIDARRQSTADREEFALTVQGEARTAGGLARFLPLPGPAVTAGTLVLQAEGKASLPGGATPTDWPTLVHLLPDSRVVLNGDAILGGVAFADGTKGVSAHLPLVAALGNNQVTLTLRDDAQLRIEQPARASLRGLGVPEDVLPMIASGLNLTLASGRDLPFRLAAKPAWPPETAEIAVSAQATSDQGLKFAAKVKGTAALGEALALAGFDGSLEGRADAKRLSFGGREARDVAIALPLSAEYTGGDLHLALTKPGSLQIGRFGAGAPLHLKKPLHFEVGALRLKAQSGGGYDYSLSARQGGAAFDIAAAEAEPVAISTGALTVQLDGRFDPANGHAATLAVRLSGFDLPSKGFSAKVAEIDITLDHALRPATSRFTLGPFQAGGQAPVTAPLALAGTLKRAGAGYDVNGELSLSAGQVLADLKGRYGDDGTASLKAESRLLSFAPDGLQPAALSPLLTDLEKVSGSVTASATVVWPRDPTEESARISLKNLSFKVKSAEVSGLDLDLDLDSLTPLSTAAGERLTIRSVDAGVPVEAISIDFSLDQAPEPHASIEDGGFTLGGGRWRIEPTVLDPAEPRNHVVLATDGLDLSSFFALIQVEGLSGNGKLAGRVPIQFSGQDVVIKDGHFEANGPGRLSIRIDALRSALASGGDTVQAAVQALEDFHYEELSLDLAKTAANDATVKLSTLGSNPAVMDGQPFRFNINLESNLTSLLNALAQGYSLSDQALQKAWHLRK